MTRYRILCLMLLLLTAFVRLSAELPDEWRGFRKIHCLIKPLAASRARENPRYEGLVASSLKSSVVQDIHSPPPPGQAAAKIGLAIQ